MQRHIVDEQALHRLQQQTEQLRSLVHQNIVRYLDFFTTSEGEFEENICLVMGISGRRNPPGIFEEKRRGMPWPRVKEVFEQCLAALIYARETGCHASGLKAGEYFSHQVRPVKIIDFDIARRDDSSQASTAGWKGTF